MDSLWEFLTKHYQIITSLAGLVVALSALILTLWQLYVLQRHNKLSVRPLLATWIHVEDNPTTVLITLINNGLGPALIKKFNYCRADGSPLEGKPDKRIGNAMASYFSDYSDVIAIDTSFMGIDYAMAPGEVKTLVKLVFNCKNPPSEEFIDEQFAKVRLQVEYWSFYEEKFDYDSAKDLQRLEEHQKPKEPK